MVPCVGRGLVGRAGEVKAFSAPLAVCGKLLWSLADFLWVSSVDEDFAEIFPAPSAAIWPVQSGFCGRIFCSAEGGITPPPLAELFALRDGAVGGLSIWGTSDASFS